MNSLFRADETRTVALKHNRYPGNDLAAFSRTKILRPPLFAFEDPPSSPSIRHGNEFIHGLISDIVEASGSQRGAIGVRSRAGTDFGCLGIASERLISSAGISRASALSSCGALASVLGRRIRCGRDPEHPPVHVAGTGSKPVQGTATSCSDACVLNTMATSDAVLTTFRGDCFVTSP